MFRRSFFLCILAILAPACLGCRESERAELEKVKAELAEARAELKLKAEQQPGYLDELERLAALRTKGVLTQEEFESKKKAALGRPPTPTQAPPQSPMDELAKQLRMTQSLYSNSTITSVEKDNRKRQLIAGPLSLTDLKKDLETAQGLHSEGVITSVERDTLKKRLLEMDLNKK